MRADDIWKASLSLYGLIEGKENREASYQTLFENYKVIFNILGFDAAESFEKSSGNSLPFSERLGYRPEPDFLCADRLSGDLTVLDLKTPFTGKPTTSRSKGARRKFKAEIESYVSQVEESAEYIEEEPSARKIICDVLGISEINSVNSALVLGLSTDNSPGILTRLVFRRKRPLRVLAFDEVLDNLLQAYAIGRRDMTARQGFGFFLVVRLNGYEKERKSYIIDIGDSLINRLSLFIERGYLVAECVDSAGKAYESASSALQGSMYRIAFEYSNDDEGILISLRVNDDEVDLRQGARPLSLELDHSNFALGSDLSGQNRGVFDMFEYFAFARTLDIEDKIRAHDYVRRKNYSSYLEFDGTKAMRAVPGALIAVREEDRPIYREASS